MPPSEKVPVMYPEYVTLDRYKSDMGRLEKALDHLSLKIDEMRECMMKCRVTASPPPPAPPVVIPSSPVEPWMAKVAIGAFVLYVLGHTPGVADILPMIAKAWK